MLACGLLEIDHGIDLAQALTEGQLVHGPVEAVRAAKLEMGPQLGLNVVQVAAVALDPSQ